MKSGWPDDGRDWDQEYYRIGLEQLVDRTFVQKTFAPAAALVAKKPVDGYRLEREYTGGEFDADEFELVQGRWDHDHCLVCYFRIEPGHTYWENGDGLIVCDVCHEHVQGRSSPLSR